MINRRRKPLVSITMFDWVLCSPLPCRHDLASLAIAFIGICLSTISAAAEPVNHPRLASPEGKQLLKESTDNESFLPLVAYFVTQDNTAFCGPASCTMVLNASGITRPSWAQQDSYHLFTQENFFSPEVQRVAPRERVSGSGMTLDVLGQSLKAWNLQADIRHASDTTLVEFRQTTRRALSSKHQFVLVNYFRPALEQDGGGHISPLAAYHEQSDRFLILDVARYRYPAVWITAQELWKAMATKDPDSRKDRGFVIVSKAQP